MKYLGIDYGGKRVGIAVSDGDGKIAFPRDTLQNDADLVSSIAKLVESEKIGLIIVGDTRSHSGAKNSVSAEADSFVEDLVIRTGVAVERGWEVWSSIEAGRYAPKGHEHDDGAAAAIILQRFLDMNKQVES